MTKTNKARVANGIAILKEDIAVNYLKSIWASDIKTRESIYLVMLDPWCRVYAWERIGIGSLNSCAIDVNKTLATALRYEARKILISHNHPSGNAAPSKADFRLTKELLLRCKCLGIELFDHVIITPIWNSFSFKADGLIEQYSRDADRMIKITDPSSFECKALQLIDTAFQERLQGREVDYIAEKVNGYLDRLYVKFFDPINIKTDRL